MYSNKLAVGFLSLILGLFFSVSALAEAKIAVINVQKAILESEGAQVIMKQIKEELKDEEKKLMDLQKEITGLMERARKDSEVMSDGEKRKLQQQVEAKQTDYQYEGQKYQRSVELRQQELFAGIDQKVQKAIEELVKSDDYDLILHRGQVIFAAEVYDITRKVTEKLNKMK